MDRHVNHDDPMRRIPLYGRGGVIRDYAIVDDCDFARISAFRWHLNITTSGQRRARRGYWNGERVVTVLMHRDVLGLGPADPLIDHRDRNSLNNTRANLRLTNQHVNQHNRDRAVYTNVRPIVGGWLVDISVNGRRHRRKQPTRDEALRLAASLRATAA